MTWTKVNHGSNEPIKHNSGWYICDYISGEYRINSNSGKWDLIKNGEKLGTYKTLKAAKAEAES